MDREVYRVAETIRERYSEPLSLDDLARTAYVSKFHLIRRFRRVTSVTPARFLSAVRLQEAKRRLEYTSLRVADISVQVGYSSTGSFTRRFTDAVGLSPTQYRRMSRGDRFDWKRPKPTVATCDGSILGRIQTTERTSSAIFVGAFNGPILQGKPIASVLLDRLGAFEIRGLPCGEWFLHAVALRPGAFAGVRCDTQLLYGIVSILVKERRSTAGVVELVIRPPRLTDPPILFALLDLEPFDRSNHGGASKCTVTR